MNPLEKSLLRLLSALAMDGMHIRGLWFHPDLGEVHIDLILLHRDGKTEGRTYSVRNYIGVPILT